PIGLMHILRLIVEAHMALNDWFIEDCFVSPEPGKVFISTARDAVMFTPGKGSGCEDQIKGILYYAEKELLIPGAGKINERFSSLGTRCFEDKRGLLRFLSRWEEELRQ
ncbi:MAG: hypothetical protein IJM17_06565, partial [Firmicutes bacterium]|nr:hypothetical protein [Bacillota bacterium]